MAGIIALYLICGILLSIYFLYSTRNDDDISIYGKCFTVFVFLLLGPLILIAGIYHEIMDYIEKVGER